MIDLIEPSWPLAERVRVLTTTRSGGVSQAPFSSLNLATHVGDDPRHVAENRRRLAAATGGAPVQWLDQVHAVDVFRARHDTIGRVPTADAVWTSEVGLALAVLTADCLPVVLVDADCQALAVAHAGWRGLVAGVLAAACGALPAAPAAAWIGPGIGPGAYEVGAEVLDAVRSLGEAGERAIRAGKRPDKGYLDLFALAEAQLRALGVGAVYCERLCTWSSDRLYSYRRDGPTGRMATLAWLL